ncbi:MAG: DUF3105 domain-containing protein [Caldilineaceae bacterium]
MASQAKANKSSRGSVRKNTLREKAAKQRRNQNMIIIGAAAVFLLVIGAIIFVNVRNAQPVAGEEALPSLGNMHIDFGSPSPITYNSTPPTSGPHYGNLVGWGVYNEPQRYEHLIHNLEDGGVVVYYQCPDGCPEIVDELRQIVQPYISAGRHVVMVPNDPAWSINGGPLLQKDMEAKIALTAWQHILKLDTVDTEKIKSFIDHYEGIDHHVAGIG